jgi:hypothetical protein
MSPLYCPTCPVGLGESGPRAPHTLRVDDSTRCSHRRALPGHARGCHQSRRILPLRRSVTNAATCLWDSNSAFSQPTDFSEIGQVDVDGRELSWPSRSFQNSKSSRVRGQLRVFVRAGRAGGESGIRTLAPPLDSVTCRFHNARVAVDASHAVAPCPPLAARMSRRMGGACLKSAGSLHHHSHVHGSWGHPSRRTSTRTTKST